MCIEPLNKNNTYRKTIIAVCLIGIIAFFIITNIIWLAIDTTPPFYDHAIHMYNTYSLSKDLRGIAKYPSYPPLVYFTTMPIIKIMGAKDDHFVYDNFLYIIILVLSVFGIGKILFDEWVGVSSAFLVLLYPFVFWISRKYYLDFALLAMVSLVQYIILKSDGGTRKYWNIGLGVAIGCTLLTKTHGLIFFLPTWIIVFLNYYKDKKGKNLIRLLQVLIIILIIALPWYLITMDGFVKWNIELYNITKILPFNKNLSTSVLFYYRMIYQSIIFPFLFFVFLGGFASFLIFDRRRTILIFLLSWIIIPYIALTLWPNKEPRFILPILPAFAILMMGGMSRLPKKLIKNIACGFVFFIALIQFSDFSFNLPIRLSKSPRVHGSSPTRPSRLDWKIKETLDFFSSYAGQKRVFICVLTNLPYFNGDLFIYYVPIYGLPFSSANYRYAGTDIDSAKVKFNRKKIKQCNFVITAHRQNGNGSVESICPLRFGDEMCEKFDRTADEFGFSKIKEFDLPENNKASIYENMRKRAQEN
jgi:4-amino-4-deoxy-L-arabinose transferase-like glycosyltransferase